MIALAVVILLLGVLAAVYLDYQPFFRAEEIHNIRANCLLPAELVTTHLAKS